MGVFDSMGIDRLNPEWDEETRQLLATLLTLRNQLRQQQCQVDAMRIQQLTGGNVTEADIDAYTTQNITPLRGQIAELSMPLLLTAINVDEIKKMLPMILSLLPQVVDIRLVMLAAGFDEDAIDGVITKVRELISGG